MGYTTTSREELVIPDGLFVAKRQGKPCVVAVELELHAKGHARYDHILDSYAGKSSIGALWYIVPQLSIAKTVLKRLRNISDAKFTLISSLLEEIVRDPANARVLFPGGEAVPLGSFFKPLQTHETAHPLSREGEENPANAGTVISTAKQALPSAPA